MNFSSSKMKLHRCDWNYSQLNRISRFFYQFILGLILNTIVTTGNYVRVWGAGGNARFLSLFRQDILIVASLQPPSQSLRNTSVLFETSHLENISLFFCLKVWRKDAIMVMSLLEHLQYLICPSYFASHASFPLLSIFFHLF